MEVDLEFDLIALGTMGCQVVIIAMICYTLFSIATLIW